MKIALRASKVSIVQSVSLHFFNLIHPHMFDILVTGSEMCLYPPKGLHSILIQQLQVYHQILPQKHPC